jgi:hypothetical protein
MVTGSDLLPHAVYCDPDSDDHSLRVFGRTPAEAEARWRKLCGEPAKPRQKKAKPPLYKCNVKRCPWEISTYCPHREKHEWNPNRHCGGNPGNPECGKCEPVEEKP